MVAQSNETLRSSSLQKTSNKALLLRWNSLPERYIKKSLLKTLAVENEKKKQNSSKENDERILLVDTLISTKF